LGLNHRPFLMLGDADAVAPGIDPTWDGSWTNLDGGNAGSPSATPTTTASPTWMIWSTSLEHFPYRAPSGQ